MNTLAAIALAAAFPGGVIHLLISLLVLALVLVLAWWIVGLLPFPDTAKQIILAIIGLIALLYLLSYLGFAF